MGLSGAAGHLPGRVSLVAFFFGAISTGSQGAKRHTRLQTVHNKYHIVQMIRISGAIGSVIWQYGLGNFCCMVEKSQFALLAFPPGQA